MGRCAGGRRTGSDELMFDRRATYIAWVLGGLALLPAGASADDADTTKIAKRAPEPPADAELLEYLGSVDAEEDQEWMDYLARTDITQVVKAKKSPATDEVADP
jgi:hypothetical protein